jgi:hypothetical protein
MSLAEKLQALTDEEWAELQERLVAAIRNELEIYVEEAAA